MLEAPSAQDQGMDSPSMHPSSPVTPLHPATPDRTNRRPLPFSPARSSVLSSHLKEDPFFSSSHRSSDVQGKVLQFNQLAESLSPKRKDNDAALRRAVLGREEAESRTRRLEEENQRLQNIVEEGRGREMKVAQRLETMMEEVQRHQESGLKMRSVYEKEVKRARKEAFKVSSEHVMLQEELKTARNRYTLMREEVDVQKRKLAEKEEEAFAAQYRLVGAQEELHVLAQRMKLVEQERDALRTSLKEEEIARIAAEGRIPLPPSTPSDEFASPRKSGLRTPVYTRETVDKDNADPFGPDRYDARLEELQRDLATERRRHIDTQGLIRFMKLECQLHACSCRRAEQQGANYVFDESLPIPERRAPPKSLPYSQTLLTDRGDLLSPFEESVLVRQPATTSPELETLIEFSPATGTFSKTKSPRKQMASMEDTMGMVHPAAIASDQADTTAPPTAEDLLAPPPLAPTDISESPSILSLPGRASDDCYMLSVLPTESSVILDRPASAELVAATRMAGVSLTEAELLSPFEPDHDSSDCYWSHTNRPPPPRESVRSADARSNTSMLANHGALSKASMVRSASPPPPAASKPSMRFVETSQTITVPLADPATPSAPKEKARMPFTPGPGADEDRGKMPFTPGATKTREEALQSIRRWREANKGGAGQSKARARSVTTGSATPRRPAGEGSPARRDISAPSARNRAM